MYWKREKCSGLWRSEDMIRLDIIVQREALHDSICQLGLLGKAQFIDVNEAVNAFSRPFAADIRYCEDLQRKIRFIDEQMKKDDRFMQLKGLDFGFAAPVVELRDSGLLESCQLHIIEERLDATLSSLEAMISCTSSILVEMNTNEDVLHLYGRLKELVQTGVVDSSGGAILASGSIAEASGDVGGVTTAAATPPPSSSGDDFSSLRQLSSVIGVIPLSNADLLRKMTYRVSRGNAVVEVFPEEKEAPTVETMASFTVFCSSRVMREKVRRVALGLKATLYTVEEILDVGPRLLQAQAEQQQQQARPAVSPSPLVATDSTSGLAPNSSASAGLGSDGGTDLRTALRNIKQQQHDLFCGWYREHRVYKTALQVEKSVYATMNLCLISGSTCTASVWVPRRYERVVQLVLEDAVVTSGSSVQSVVTPHVSQRNPPTYFETNRFTASFQSIVDSYGMARYKEVNPGVFTIITFPYLFGIMFGDIGHGVLLLAVALFFIAKERQWQGAHLNEIVGMIFGGRYLLLLMAVFAIYMGFLYNDFFGFSVNLFPSAYEWPPMEQQHGTVYPTSPNGLPSVKPRHVYAFGLDSAWSETETKLEFYNSVKMKCSVIVGVLQMFAGVLLSLNNDWNERNWHRIAFMFVPEFIFLFCTFGYMSILIIVKWCITWENTNDAPSILEIMTNFFLQPGSVPKKLFKGQAGLQVFLLIFAFLMVPVLLLGMPTVEILRYEKWKKRYYGETVVLGAENVNSSNNNNNNNNNHGTQTTAASGGGGAAPAPVMVSDAESSVDLFGPEDAQPAAHGARHADEDQSFSVPQPGAPHTATEAEVNEKYLNFDMAEMMIHYIIHTIEYVLSSVSNTASYLRLWALSLAHAQLSEVFFTFAVVNVLDIEDSSGVVLIIGVFLWLLATLAVLVGMEALSAFLHALRLHWVEFQNKFYAGDGIAFEPFDLVQGFFF